MDAAESETFSTWALSFNWCHGDKLGLEETTTLSSHEEKSSPDDVCSASWWRIINNAFHHSLLAFNFPVPNSNLSSISDAMDKGGRALPQFPSLRRLRRKQTLQTFKWLGKLILPWSRGGFLTEMFNRAGHFLLFCSRRIKSQNSIKSIWKFNGNAS